MSVNYNKIVIDTDGGLDDAQAILISLKSPSVSVVAITTVHGNTTLENATKNILRLLEAADRMDVPVYMGANVSLIGHSAKESFYHGKDGFGDVPDPSAPDLSHVAGTNAATKLTELTAKQKGRITLVTLGPLTNIAMALRLDPTFASNLRECYVMGGNMYGKGNESASGEFNFHTDPEAAYVALRELQCPVTICTWELCLQHSASWLLSSMLRFGSFQRLQDNRNMCAKEWYKKSRSRDTKLAKFLFKLETSMRERVEKDNWPRYLMADELAMASCIGHVRVGIKDDCGTTPVMKRVVRLPVSIELSGHVTRGQMICDWRHADLPSVEFPSDRSPAPGAWPVVNIVQELDQEVLYHLLDRAIDD